MAQTFIWRIFRIIYVSQAVEEKTMILYSVMYLNLIGFLYSEIYEWV
jgi:hypothetical protein